MQKNQTKYAIHLALINEIFIVHMVLLFPVGNIIQIIINS